MKEQMRIKQDYGTVCGYTGKWLVQHRFFNREKWTEWTTCYIADSEAEARLYIDVTPDWVKNF